jgi:GNAT superfamily N-acetyltransferase
VSRVHVRSARPEDAAALAEMANDLNEHVGIRTRPFSAEVIRRDAFGCDPAFTAVVAERDRVVVGYAFFALGYNTDVAGRSMWLHDLFVVPAARGLGVGHALMASVASETVRRGGLSMEWGVHEGNHGAIEFYRRLGAVGGGVRLMGVADDRLRALAARAT